jgi:fluoroquinolone transport system permease protein
MVKWIYYKTDLKRLFRDQITTLLFFAPLLLSVIFKLLFAYLPPILLSNLDFDIMVYQHYILSFVLVINAGLLAMVMGFSMQEDKDSHMIVLLSVTPLGKSGYMLMRFSMVAIMVFVYSFLCYAILGIYILTLTQLLLIAILLCFYASMFGLILFNIAEDKVSALTYAKGLNIFVLFIFSRLVNVKWVDTLSSFFPTYWINALIISPNDAKVTILSIVVHLVWFFGVFLFVSVKKQPA